MKQYTVKTNLDIGRIKMDYIMNRLFNLSTADLDFTAKLNDEGTKMVSSFVVPKTYYGDELQELDTTNYFILAEVNVDETIYEIFDDYNNLMSEAKSIIVASFKDCSEISRILNY